MKVEESKKEENMDLDSNEFLIKFKNSYMFEGNLYKTVDLSGLENLKAADMIDANKIMERGGTINVIPEMSLQYACIISSKATGMPVEFFNNLPPKEALKVKNRVTNFLYGED